MWDEIKAAASEVLLTLFAGALRAVKQTLDPDGILNPGVLLDPPR
jgi:FAD/FMN-containing dehydrogenase